MRALFRLKFSIRALIFTGLCPVCLIFVHLLSMKLKCQIFSVFWQWILPQANTTLSFAFLIFEVFVVWVLDQYDQALYWLPFLLKCTCFEFVQVGRSGSLSFLEVTKFYQGNHLQTCKPLESHNRRMLYWFRCW